MNDDSFQAVMTLLDAIYEQNGPPIRIIGLSSTGLSQPCIGQLRDKLKTLASRSPTYAASLEVLELKMVL